MLPPMLPSGATPRARAPGPLSRSTRSTISVGMMVVAVSPPKSFRKVSEFETLKPRI